MLNVRASGSVVNANFRMTVEKVVAGFIIDDTVQKYEFPESLIPSEILFVRNYVNQFDVKTVLVNKGARSQLTMFRVSENTGLLTAVYSSLTLKSMTEQIMYKLICKFNESSNRTNDKTCVDMEAPRCVQRSNSSIVPQSECQTMAVPPPYNGVECLEQRMNLPIYPYRNEILHTIASNQIVLIQSSTGSGKSTQIPQYIMEEATELNKSCRIICSQPRRLSAVSVAERVAYERNEETGKTVGYQIRLESKVSPNSNLIYCTNGVLLRCLMSGDPAEFFNKATHLIIDEVHQRCKFTDFLLIAIKTHALKYPHMKIIIMSATLEAHVFSDYFNGCTMMQIPGYLHEVTEYFLEDILKITNSKYCQNPWISEIPLNTDQPLREDTKIFLNGLLSKMLLLDSPDNEFSQFFLMVQTNDIPVDYRQPETKMTALMIAAERDYFEHVKTLLEMKANPELTIIQEENLEVNCYDIAMNRQNSAIAQLLRDQRNFYTSIDKSQTTVTDQRLLERYFNSSKKLKEKDLYPEEIIDLNLILNLICKIHQSHDKNGAIMVFLTGYDDILQLSNLINTQLEGSDFKLFLLHSNMHVKDQKDVFQPVGSNIRKIVLTTNIAETSITIPEICHVLDSGKEKQKCYDYVFQSSMLRSQWISKAVAIQRKGRAGRLQKGNVYRFYSRDRYNFMLENTIPELVRTDLTEICLQTKLLEKEMLIEEYLMQAISPPQKLAIRRSIKLLKRLGALDNDENLTTLGFHLADIPIDAKLSKMLIYGIIFKCIDPILTLVSCLSIQDPFIIVHNPQDRLKYIDLKQSLAEKSFSDHLVLLRIFQRWNNFKTENSNDRVFCEENFINIGTMERINGTRSKIIGHLRSLGIIKSNGNLTLMNNHSTKWSVVKLCLSAGLYPNIAKVDRKSGNIHSELDKKLLVHTTSCLYSTKTYPTEWVIFEEKFKIGKTALIKCCTTVTPLTIAFTAGNELNVADINIGGGDDDNNSSILQVDNWIKLITTHNNVVLVRKMRNLVDELMNKYLKDVRDYKFTEQDGYLIDAIATIIQTEDESNGFPVLHSGIGARPRAITLRSMDYNSGTSNTLQPQASGPSSNFTIDNQSMNVQEVPVLNTKHFIMVKVAVDLFRNSFAAAGNLGNRNVVDAREFNFPTSFYDQLLGLESGGGGTYIMFCSAMPPQVMGLGQVLFNQPVPISIRLMCKKFVNVNELGSFSNGLLEAMFDPNFYYREVSDKFGYKYYDLCMHML